MKKTRSQNKTDTKTPEILDSRLFKETTYYIEIIQNSKRAYKCTAPDCGKIYRFKSEADRHAVMHQEDRPYCCNFTGCAKTFKRPETLEDHMRIHEGSLPFPCDKPGCDKRFASKPALRYHRLLHKNNRKFKCDVEGCDKSFLTLCQLKQHQKAPGSHLSKPTLDLPENKPVKIFKSDPMSDTDSVTKISESIYWEMKTQKCKVASPEENKKENYDLIRDILAENRLLKEKLQEYEKAKPKESPEMEMEIKDQFNFDFSNLVSPSNKVEPNCFLDSYELNLLDFLKEKDENNL